MANHASRADSKAAATGIPTYASQSTMFVLTLRPTCSTDR